MDLTYFNPLSQSEDDFLDSFIARQDTLRFLLAQLTGVPARNPASHHLLIAPRGFGKTSLLRRIAIAVRADETLRDRFIPLSFREEQHNVISLDLFWRNCLQSLLDAREDEGASENELDEIDDAWEKTPPRQALTQEEQDGEPARRALKRFCDRLGRRPILLIDNLDTLLAGLKEPHRWDLRKRLQSADGPVMIAAASRYPEDVSHGDAAFYGFFRTHTLDRLSDREVFSCLKTIARRRDEPGRAVLRLIDEDPGRVAALNEMAGGNPRTLGVLYVVLESHADADMLAQLGAMLDTFTGWYQARTDELPVQARAVFDALALNWHPMTAADLGAATGLDTPVVSSQLSRLERLGYVEPVSGSGRGRKRYELGERFFNIWYLMRNGPRRARRSVQFLTAFLRQFFDEGERRQLARRVIAETGTAEAYRLALADAIDDETLKRGLLERIETRRIDAPAAAARPGRLAAELSAARADGHRHAYGGDVLNDSTMTGRVEVPPPNGNKVDDELADLVERGRELLSQGQHEEAITYFDKVIDRLGQNESSASPVTTAKALCGKGVGLSLVGGSIAALDIYDEVVARFGEADDAALREQVALALIHKGITLGTPDRAEDAIAVYDEIVARFGETDAAALRGLVAKALFAKGLALGTLDRAEDAIAAYDELVARFGEADAAALRVKVASALVGKGFALGALDRAEDAIAVYDEIVARFGETDQPALRELVTMALVQSGNALRTLNLLERSEATFERAIAHDPEVGEPYLYLGNLLLDDMGNASRAHEVFLAGIESAKEPDLGAILHLNAAYATALSGGSATDLEAHAREALDREHALPESGLDLLKALCTWNADRDGDWKPVFERIGAAVSREDTDVWDSHLDDLQRLCWLIIAHGGGEKFIDWMEAEGFPDRYAPFYHAVVAALDGEDHLLDVHAEARGPAAKIHGGIARLATLYADLAAPRKRSGHAGSRRRATAKDKPPSPARRK